MARNIRHEKFGIKIPRPSKEAYFLERESNTDYWARAISKELRPVDVALGVKPFEISPPELYHKKINFILCST